MKFIKNWGWLILSIVTIGVNILATSLPLNNQTTGQISDRLFTVLTPAGFTFAIWGVIYAGLVVIGLLLGFKKQTLSRIGLIYYGLSSLTNILWILLWHYDQPIISAVVLLIVFFSNLLTYFELKRANPKVTVWRSLTTSWFLIYLGWTLVASVINITIALKQLGFDGLGLQDIYWAAAVLTLAGLINLFLSWREKNPTTALVFVWSLWGIYNAQQDLFLRINLFRVAAATLIAIAVIAVNSAYVTWKSGHGIKG